jgi:hypothetical protein
MLVSMHEEVERRVAGLVSSGRVRWAAMTSCADLVLSDLWTLCLFLRARISTLPFQLCFREWLAPSTRYLSIIDTNPDKQLLILRYAGWEVVPLVSFIVVNVRSSELVSDFVEVISGDLGLLSKVEC